MDIIKPTTIRSPLTQFQHDFMLNKICEKIRQQLIAVHEVTPTNVQIEQAIDLYEIISPAMHALLKDSTLTTKRQHLRSLLKAPMVIYVRGSDPFVDFKRLAEYADTVWPGAKIQEYLDDLIVPKYITQGGKEVCTVPGSLMLLEKVAPDLSEVSSTQFSSHSLGKLYAYHSSLVDMCRHNDTKISDEFLDWNDFRKWAESTGYKDGLRLERKVIDLGFVPSNVSWQERSFRGRVPDPQIHDRVEIGNHLGWRGEIKP